MELHALIHMGFGFNDLKTWVGSRSKQDNKKTAFFLIAMNFKGF